MMLDEPYIDSESRKESLTSYCSSTDRGASSVESHMTVLTIGDGDEMEMR